MYSDEVGTDERDVVNLAEHLDYTRVVNARYKGGEQISEQRWLLLQVERKGLVVAEGDISQTVEYAHAWQCYIHLDVGNLDDDFLELIVLPSIRRVLHHSQGSIVLFNNHGQQVIKRQGRINAHKFIILDVQEDELGPEVGLFCSFEDLRAR